MLFVAAPAQANDLAPSACIAAAEMDFSNLPSTSVEVSNFFSEMFPEADAEMIETLTSEYMMSINTEEYARGRFWRWICRTAIRVFWWTGEYDDYLEVYPETTLEGELERRCGHL